MFKLNKLTASVAVALLAVGAGSAQAAKIDPFGLGGAGGVYEVANLGWNNGNAISTPISVVGPVDDTGTPTTPGGAVALVAVGDTIQTYGQAKLQGLNDADGNTFVIAGFNPNNWTYVFGFSEVVTTAPDPTTPGEGSAVFRTTTIAGQANYFEIWANGAAAVDLTGKGFNGDGGATLLVSGKIADYDDTTGIGQTSFTSSSKDIGALDQFNTDNYTDYTSVQGTGGGKINIKIETVNDKYFLDGLSLLTLDLITDTFQNLPFIQINPSSCFWDGGAYFEGAGNGIAGGCGAVGDGGSIGFVNGIDTRFAPGGSPDWTNIMFQTRATTVLPTGLPEPGTLTLLGLGALGLFLRRRKA